MDRQDRGIRLIGRAPELEVLQAEVRRSAAGRFRVVVVEGAAGVGKSRLISEVAGFNQSHRVISARSFRLGATSSFGPWMEALERFRLSHPEAERGLVPRVTEEMNRARILEELTTTLRRLAEDEPLLVLLDDIHLSDDSSWEALRYVGRRLSDRSIAVVAAARPEGLRSNPLATDVLLALEDEGHLRRVSLRPLSTAEMADLSRAVLSTLDVRNPVLSQRLVDWLMERTLGHPLFAISLLRAVVAEGGSLTSTDLTDLPVSLRDRVVLELHSLSAIERQVLELGGAQAVEVALDRFYAKVMEPPGQPLFRWDPDRPVEGQAARLLGHGVWRAQPVRGSGPANGSCPAAPERARRRGLRSVHGPLPGHP